MTQYGLRADPLADLDVEAVVRWYERQRSGLGRDFLRELRAAYARILAGLLGYQGVRWDTRRALLRRFPYAVYFLVDGDVVVVVAVLHTSRDPAEWQRRRTERG